MTRWERFGARASTSSKPSNCMGENLTSPLSIRDLSRILEIASRRKRNRRHRRVHDSLGVHQRTSHVGMNGWEMTFSDILSRAPRVAAATVMLVLIATLVWALSLSWYLPAGGAAAGGLIGWRNPLSGSGKADTALTYTVRGAVLGLSIVFLYHSGCTSDPQESRDQESKRETLVQPPSFEGS